MSGEGGRRRRRGRRGGRRNRHGRNGDASFAGETSLAENAGAINEAPPPEPSLRHAVEDLDRPPAPFADERPPFEQLSPDDRAATRNRRADARPIRAPAVSRGAVGLAEPSASNAGRVQHGKRGAATPKRGWWGRRLLGDKS